MVNRRSYHLAIQAILFAVAWTYLAGCQLGVSCLAESTLIWTERGPRPIEEIRVGDMVWTRSNDASVELGQVVHLRSAVSRQTIEFTFSDEKKLRTTPAHPIFVDGQWTIAGGISVGQQFVGPSGVFQVKKLTPLDDPIRVFDLTVAPNANFFANGVLVHNKTIYRPPTAEELAGVWIGQSTYGGSRYLIELNADGTGRAVRTQGLRLEEVGQLQFESWEINEFEIKILFSSESAPPYPPTTHCFVGRATKDHLFLQHFLSGIRGTAAPVVFAREGSVRHDIERLMSALHDAPLSQADARTGDRQK